MKKLIFIFIFIFFTTPSKAFDRELFVAGGLGFSSASIKSKYLEQIDDDDNEMEDETKTAAFGVTTRFGYRLLPSEFGVISDIGYGKVENIRFNESSTSTAINGDGHYRLVAISPYYKHNFSWQIKSWGFYLGGGPSWSLQTLVIKNVNNGVDFNTKKRISFENFGGGIFLGAEELLPYKNMHSTFIEVGYSFMASYKVSVVDASDFKDTRTISSRKARDLYGSFFFVRLGVVLF